MADEELRSLKEAIIDLYLAIKIRSTEEVFPLLFNSLILTHLFQLDQIDEDHLGKEKNKLLKQDGLRKFSRYIRSSIEIIMNLKIEDLEREMNQKKLTETGDNSSSIAQSVTSQKFVHQSMREALAGQNEFQMESQKGNI